MKFQPPSVYPASRLAVAGDILMVLGHHLILNMARLDRPIIGFIQLQAQAILRKGKVREPVKSENLSSWCLLSDTLNPKQYEAQKQLILYVFLYYFFLKMRLHSTNLVDKWRSCIHFCRVNYAYFFLSRQNCSDKNWCYSFIYWHKLVQWRLILKEKQ